MRDLRFGSLCLALTIAACGGEILVKPTDRDAGQPDDQGSGGSGANNHNGLGGANGEFPSHCYDGQVSGDESAADCGGSCAGCKLGSSCSTAGDCQSQYCADEVCCDQACDGECQACTMTKNGTAQGLCLPAPLGTDPDGECPSLQHYCDGNGSCTSCVTSTTVIEPLVGLDLFMVIDRSGSMGSSYWPNTVGGLTDFFSDPESSGVNVALNLFPAPQATNNECVTGLYDPPQVSLGMLPQNNVSLTAALDVLPGGTTPMYGALDGTFKAAIAHKLQYPNHGVVVVLATDGNPCCGDCADHYGGNAYEQISTIVQLTADAFQQGVLTYAIAIDALIGPDLDPIAAAGGTHEATGVSGNGALLTQRLEEIRTERQPCTYWLPDLDAPESLNISFSVGGTVEMIPDVQSIWDCDIDPGWYLGADLPLRLHFCPASCQDLSDNPAIVVELIEGCLTHWW